MENAIRITIEALDDALDLNGQKTMTLEVKGFVLATETGETVSVCATGSLSLRTIGRAIARTPYIGAGISRGVIDAKWKESFEDGK